MKPTAALDTQISIRIHNGMAERASRIETAMNGPGSVYRYMGVTRAAVFRLALARGLLEMESEWVQSAKVNGKGKRGKKAKG